MDADCHDAPRRHVAYRGHCSTVFDEDTHWGGPADDELGGDERHEQGHVRAPDGEVLYHKDWDGVERAAGKAEASPRLLHRVCAMAQG